jgi:aspartyl protease family protein
MNYAVALLLSGGLATLGCSTANAQAVALTGMLGDKALLVVDGSTPKGVAAGDTYLGVKVISTVANTAIVEVAGLRQTLRVGDSPISVKGRSDAANGGRVVLQAGSNGHFISAGQINGRAVQFLVDTGASAVTLSLSEAERIGLNYKAGQVVRMNTANGVVQGWRIKLGAVRLGTVDVYEVDAVVASNGMPYVLLGNSFLTRFQMVRTNDQLVLEKRY